jgi:hypothetical protein
MWSAPSYIRNSIARQRGGKHAFGTIEEAMFSIMRGPCRGYITSVFVAPHINKPAIV